MRRIFSQYAYGSGPRDGCWWDQTVPHRDWPEQTGDLSVDVAVVGAGFTGLNVGLGLVQGGASVAILEANHPGWGASGRNGGFCCLGGGRISDAELTRRFGAEGAHAFDMAQKDAVDHVATLLDRHGIDADVHSEGETELAHDTRRMDELRRQADEYEAVYGQPATVIEARDLAAHGMAGSFKGALTTPIGFALNPRKYLEGLLTATHAAGAQIFGNSPVMAIDRVGGGFVLRTAKGAVRCAQVVIATNGYSSEDIPAWMRARYMPAQSNVMVTRPLTQAEMDAQGWTSGQMSYDTLNLLHYFRLMPDRRFLFGMRGGLLSSPRAEHRARQRLRGDFDRMFPAWAKVEGQHQWSGMVCLSAKRLPFVGPVPGEDGMFAAFAYHGNGVAMGSYSGWLLSRRILEGDQGQIPEAMSAEPGRFPLGRARRLLMPPIYAALKLAQS